MSDIALKRTKVNDESRPLREIHSVMMTTSGFLSPAREGKLPESRTPVQPRAVVESLPRASPIIVSPELKPEKKVKKIVKKMGLEERKIDKENKKKNREKDLFKPDKVNDTKVKKLSGIKELCKLKPLKTGGVKGAAAVSSPSSSSTSHVTKDDVICKIPKNLSPKLKITKQTNNSSSMSSDKKEINISKLPVEPDKQKLNIFKKISKPREDKISDFSDHHKSKDNISRESSPGLIIDETDDVNKRHDLVRNDTEIKKEEKKTPHTPDPLMDTDCNRSRSPTSDVYMFDDMSPPGTPSTPKTPELSVPGIAPEPKKKKKDKNKSKKDNSKGLIIDEISQKVK